MRKYLEKLIERKQAEIAELQRRSDASQDLAEVRSIGAQIVAAKTEMEEARAQLAELDEEERAKAPENAPLVNGVVVNRSERKAADDDMEYRTAFMNYVLRGTPIPAEYREDANTKTTDVAAVIPTVIINKIIEKMDEAGEILKLVTKTSYPAGVVIPTSSVKPTASWVNEGAGSDRQKKTTSKVTFTYHKLRCEISMSMEVNVMAVSAFEAKFVENVVNAMVIAKETAIISGDPDQGQPEGILDSAAPSGQALTITDGAITYASLCAWEAAIPSEYEATAKWCMSKKTFMAIAAIVDSNGQPVGRVNYGLGGKPERYILGREVVITNKVSNLAAATANTFAFAFDFSDYVLNTVYDLGIQAKIDWETEDKLVKMVTSCDGHPVSRASLVTVSNVLSV